MTDTNDGVELGLSASGLEPLFRQAQVLTESLDAAKGKRARSTKIGQFLSQFVDRSVPIEINGRNGTATLRCKEGRSKAKRYHFEVRWEAGEGCQPQAGDDAAGMLPTALFPPTQPPPSEQQVQQEETTQQPDTSTSNGNNEQW